MIKTIVFDLGGVIFCSDGTTFEGRTKLAANLGADPQRWHKIWFKNKQALLHGEMTEDDYLQKVIRECNINISLNDLKQTIRSMNVIDAGMINLLQHLSKTYKLVALTNEIKEWNMYRIEKFNLKSHFSAIISSCNVKASKPDLKIYEILLNTLNLNPSETIFIDDRPENLPPAEKLGIKTIHFKNKKELFKKFSEFGVDLRGIRS